MQAGVIKNYYQYTINKNNIIVLIHLQKKITRFSELNFIGTLKNDPTTSTRNNNLQ